MHPLLKLCSQMVAPLARRVANLVGRGVVTSTDDSTKIQLSQVSLLDGEVRDEIENFQAYGFTSNPRDGAEAVVVFVGGRRDHGLAIQVADRRYRIRNLESGEVAVYNDTGAKIVLRASGDIEITPKTGQVIALAGSSNPVAKGDSMNTAISNLGTAIASALTTMGAAPAAPMPGSLAVTAGASVTAAVLSFNSAAAAALSTKVKLS